MKVIDVAQKGHLVRFYLGEDSCDDYTGDDWDDIPYEHNAGTVYEQYVKAIWDVPFKWEVSLIFPTDNNYLNSNLSMDNFKHRKCPILILVPSDVDLWAYDKELEGYAMMSTWELALVNPDTIKIYLNDKLDDLQKLLHAFIEDSPGGDIVLWKK